MNNYGVPSARFSNHPQSGFHHDSLFAIHASLFITSPAGKGYKKFPSPEQNQGWDTKYSTVPPWLRLSPSLIDAVTGVTGRAFPPRSSESGIDPGSVPKPSHQMGSSLRFFLGTHVFRQSFWQIKCNTISRPCQWAQKKSPKSRARTTKNTHCPSFLYPQNSYKMVSITALPVNTCNCTKTRGKNIENCAYRHFATFETLFFGPITQMVYIIIGVITHNKRR